MSSRSPKNCDGIEVNLYSLEGDLSESTVENIWISEKQEEGDFDLLWREDKYNLCRTRGVNDVDE